VLEQHQLPSFEQAQEHAALSLELQQLLAEVGTLSFTGLDDALPWLDPTGQPPEEGEDLLCLIGLAKRVSAVKRSLHTAPAELERLTELAHQLPETNELVAWASQRLGKDGQVPDTASAALGRLRRQLVRSRQQVLHELEAVRRSHRDVVTDAPITLRRDRYCLPVKASSQAQLKGLVLDASASGATVFVEPFAVVELNNAFVRTCLQEAAEVRRIVAEVAQALAELIPDLRTAVTILGQLDATQAKLLFGKLVKGIVVPPGGDKLLLVRARHPLLDEKAHQLRVEILGEHQRHAQRQAVRPLDFALPVDCRALVVSGPNAGGKTVVLKTIGVMTVLAYLGIPLPADEGTTIPRIARLWCHIGDEQSVADDLSTFSGAMASTAELLAETDGQTLVLFDELGAGTDPLEGAALGFALLEELCRRSCLTVVTTHLAAIALAAQGEATMGNAAMEYDEAAGTPTFRLRLGRPGRSRALEIAAAVGLPEALLERARELLGGAHLELDTWLARLEQLEGELTDARISVAQQRLALEQEHERLACDRARAEQEHARLREQLAEEREQLRGKAKRRLDEVLGKLNEAQRTQQRVGRRRQQQLRERALDLALPQQEPPERTQPGATPGDQVRVRSLAQEGILRQLRGSQAQVELGDKRLWVPITDIDLVARPTSSRPTARVVVSTGESVEPELKLLGMDAEEARMALEAYLDRALASGRPSVRVVHGHGTGALRKMVREVCRTHPAVSSFTHPPQFRGGTGATEVSLRGADG